MKNKIEMFKDITTQMCNIYEKKNSDYGDSFENSIKEFGPIAGIVRLSDKFERIKSLLIKKTTCQVKDESVRDTLLDMANYAIMLCIALDIVEIKNNDNNIKQLEFSQKNYDYTTCSEY